MRVAVIALTIMYAMGCASILGLDAGNFESSGGGGAGSGGEAGGGVGGDQGVGAGGGGEGGIGGMVACLDDPDVGVEDITVFSDPDEHFLDVVEAHPEHGIVVAGRYSVEFAQQGSSLPVASGPSCFVAWLDEDGAIEHAVGLTTTATGFCKVNDMAIDAKGNVTVVGEHSGDLTVGAGVLEAVVGNREAFAVTLSAATPPTVLWSASYASSASTDARAKVVVVDPQDQSIWIAGEFDDSLFDDGAQLRLTNMAPTNAPDIFLVHAVPGERVVFSGLFGVGTLTVEAMIPYDGRLVLGGFFFGGAWGGANAPGVPDGVDGWVGLIDPVMNNAFVWSHAIDGDASQETDRVDALATTSDGNILVGGRANSFSSAGFSHIRNGGLVLELNAAGDYQGLTSILANPDPAIVTITDVGVDARDEVYVSGNVVNGESLAVPTGLVAPFMTGFGFVGRLGADGTWLDALLMSANGGGSSVDSLAVFGCDVWAGGTIGGGSVRQVLVDNGSIFPASAGAATDYALVRFNGTPSDR